MTDHNPSLLIRVPRWENSRVLLASHPSRWMVRCAILLGVCFVLGPIALLFVPWQQNLRGTGRVVAVAPLERQQTVEAPIAGRIVQWWVQEGSQVATGDPLVEISDIAPDLVSRLEQERAALVAKSDAYEDKVQSYGDQILNLEATRDLAVAAATFRVETGRQQIRSAHETLSAKAAEWRTARAQYERIANLLTEGIVSQRQFEVAERDLEIAVAAQRSAEAALAAAQADQQALEADLEKTRTAAQARIAAIQASLSEARSQLQDARGSLAKLEVQLSRQGSQRVTAPRDGTVLRVVANLGGEIVKTGDPLCVLVPNTRDRGVELWINGVDAPLVQQGSAVRLQFEGWPAVQFVGWPSVAVGSFGGIVSLIDATDDGNGRFRVVVVPDPNDDPWPDVRFLRQGVRAKGWVLLDRVPLGYEIWRQLNGFPPVVAPSEPQGDIARQRIK